MKTFKQILIELQEIKKALQTIASNLEQKNQRYSDQFRIDLESFRKAKPLNPL